MAKILKTTFMNFFIIVSTIFWINCECWYCENEKPADIAVTNVSLSSASASSSDGIIVSFNVTSDSEESLTFSADVYLSSSNNSYEDGILLGSKSYSISASSQQYDIEVQLPVGSDDGEYFVFVVIATPDEEIIDNNSASTGLSIENPVDMSVSNVQIYDIDDSTSGFYPGERIELTFTTNNPSSRSLQSIFYSYIYVGERNILANTIVDVPSGSKEWEYLFNISQDMQAGSWGFWVTVQPFKLVNGDTVIIDTDLSDNWYNEDISINEPIEIETETVHISEGFESGAIPDTWGNHDGDGDGFSWFVNEWTYEMDSWIAGTYAVFSQSWDGDVGALTPDNQLYLPDIQLGSSGQLQYKVGAINPNYYAETYSIWITNNKDEDGDGSRDWSEIYEETLTVETHGGVDRDISLQDFAGETVTIVFRHTGSSDVLIIGFDEITVISGGNVVYNMGFEDLSDLPKNQDRFKDSGGSIPLLNDTYNTRVTKNPLHPSRVHRNKRMRGK